MRDTCNSASFLVNLTIVTVSSSTNRKLELQVKDILFSQFITLRMISEIFVCYQKQAFHTIGCCNKILQFLCQYHLHLFCVEIR